MNVLVDSSIWIAALSRHEQKNSPREEATSQLSKLIGDGRVAVIGPIRQAVLSGLNNELQFLTVAEKLAAFPDLRLQHSSYELAAEICNQCRKAGLPGDHHDFLVAAAAIEYNIELFTRRPQFGQYARYSLLKLYKP